MATGLARLSRRSLQVSLCDREAQKLGQALRSYLLGLFAIEGADCNYVAKTSDKPARSRIGFKVSPKKGPFKGVTVYLKFDHRLGDVSEDSGS